MPPKKKKPAQPVSPAHNPAKSKTGFAPVPPRPRPRLIWVFMACFALSLAFYGNTLQNGYSMDDEMVTLNQPNVERGVAGIPRILTSRYVTSYKQNYEYRPMVLITFAIEYELFGRNAAVSHFINILFYAFCCFMVYYIISRLFIQQHWILPGLATFLFVIHPLHTEVVASLKNRDEILALTFGLLAFRSFLQVVEKRRRLHILWGLVFIMLGLISKRSMLPFVFIIPFALYYVKGMRVGRLALLAVIGTVVCFGALRLMKTSLSENQVNRMLDFFENPLYSGGYGIGQKIMAALATFGFYIKMLFVPAPMVAYYGYDTVDLFNFGMLHVIGLLGVAALIFLMVKFYKTNKPVVLGAVMFIASISMFTNLLVPAVGIVAERFAFEASVGFSLMAAGLLLWAFNRSGLAQEAKFSAVNGKLKGLAAVLAIVCAIMVITRNKDWASTTSLYKADIVKVPESAKLNSLTGAYHAQVLREHLTGVKRLGNLDVKLQTDSCIRYFRKVIAVYPGYTTAYNNLGTIYINYRNNLDSGGYYFNQALTRDSVYIEAWFNLARYHGEKAEQENEKYNILAYQLSRHNAIAGNDKDSLATYAKMEPSNNLFYNMYLLKANILGAFKNIAGGKVQNGPQNIVRNIFMYYTDRMPALKITPAEIDGFVSNTVQTFTGVMQGRQFNNVEQRIDSLVASMYYPYVCRVAFSGWQYSDTLGKTLLAEVRRQTMDIRRQSLAEYKRCLELRPGNEQAYTAAMQLASKWAMPDEILPIHHIAAKSNAYKQYMVDFNTAEAHMARKAYDDAAYYILRAAGKMEKLIARVKRTAADFIAAGNPTTANALTGMEQSIQQNALFYLNRMMPFMNKNAPEKAAEITKKLAPMFNAVNKGAV